MGGTGPGDPTSSADEVPLMQIMETQLTPDPFDNYEEDMDEPRNDDAISFSKADVDQRMLYSMQTSTASFPWADLSSLLSSDEASVNQADRGLASDFLFTQPTELTNTGSHLTSLPTNDSHSRKQLASCTCLCSVAKLLEERYTCRDSSEIDALLQRLGQSIKIYSRVLACVSCDICIDHAALLAATAKQLVPTAEEVSTRLLALQERRGYGNDHFGSSRPAGPGDVVIDIGNYRLDLRHLKTRLLYKAIQLHFEDLKKALGCIKVRIAPMRAAWGILIEVEQKVDNVIWVIENLSE
ncbi:unnamed protein product [Clonostachys solani]|uniref:Uncharacterized protein n=1 Tax=Clonostachys solani TaxID=160281 RepID=A0A9P0EQE4_9HYPO|nr:unnamed protein product [Clonostachys solani]